jgi:hypothetical protein
VCVVELGSVCIAESARPRFESLGVELCEPQAAVDGDCGFRSELRGDDSVTLLEIEGASKRIVERRRVIDTVEIRVDTAATLSPTAEELEPVAAGLTVRQPSRIAREPPVASLRFDPAADGQVDPDEVASLSLAYYDATSAAAEFARLRGVLLRIDPDDGGLAPTFRWLLRRIVDPDQPCDPALGPGDCSVFGCIPDPFVAGGGACGISPNRRYRFATFTSRLCHPQLVGRAQRVAADGATRPAASVPLALRYALDPAAPAIIPPTTDRATIRLACTTDDDCGEGLRCHTPTSECFLDLTGRDAAAPTTTFDGTTPGDEEGFFRARFNTYCEDYAGTADERPLQAVVRSGAAALGLPSVSFTWDQSVREPLPGVDPPIGLTAGAVCVPDWAPPEPRRLRIRGAAVPLLASADEEWRCCSTACLPTAAMADPDAVPPPAPDDCFVSPSAGDGALDLRFEATLTAAEVDHWPAAGCLDVDRSDGIAGRLTVASTCTAAPCELDLGHGEGSLAYVLRVEPPVGSVFASAVLPLEVEAGAMDLQDITLVPRPILRGRVTLPAAACTVDASEDCGADDAIVLAERLRVAGEDPALVPGPYTFRARTFGDPRDGARGSYVLPVNPGVYVVTAIPAGRTSVGPAPIVVVDTRDGADRSLALELEPGILATLQIEGFDRDASIVPLDTGTWATVCHPDGVGADGCTRPLDLNAASECYRAAGQGEQGCTVRSLIAPGSRAFSSAANTVRFFTRDVP